MIKKILNCQQLCFQNVYFKTSILQQPKLRMRSCVQILPPPGMNLQIPEWEVNTFLLKIGGGTSEYADKFDNIKEIFTLNSRQMREKGLPAHHRKHILNIIEQLRRGIISFDYLQRRTCTEIKQAKK